MGNINGTSPIVVGTYTANGTRLHLWKNNTLMHARYTHDILLWDADIKPGPVTDKILSDPNVNASFVAYLASQNTSLLVFNQTSGSVRCPNPEDPSFNKTTMGTAMASFCPVTYASTPFAAVLPRLSGVVPNMTTPDCVKDDAYYAKTKGYLDRSRIAKHRAIGTRPPRHI